MRTAGVRDRTKLTIVFFYDAKPIVDGTAIFTDNVKPVADIAAFFSDNENEKTKLKTDDTKSEKNFDGENEPPVYKSPVFTETQKFLKRVQLATQTKLNAIFDISV